MADGEAGVPPGTHSSFEDGNVFMAGLGEPLGREAGGVAGAGFVIDDERAMLIALGELGDLLEKDRLVDAGVDGARDVAGGEGVLGEDVDDKATALSFEEAGELLWTEMHGSGGGVVTG